MPKEGFQGEVSVLNSSLDTSQRPACGRVGGLEAERKTTWWRAWQQRLQGGGGRASRGVNASQVEGAEEAVRAKVEMKRREEALLLLWGCMWV